MREVFQAKTIGTLALLQVVLPLNLALTTFALLRGVFVAPPPVAVAAQRKTILVSGGKMTKALQLARSFHAAGHRVVLVESSKYRFNGHRFSRAVDRFYTVPAPDSDNYAVALLAVVRAEEVDVYVPVCSPVASYYDALAKDQLSPHCEVLHCDADMVARLDDKYEFFALVASLGLSTPETHRVTAPGQVEEFDFTGTDYILKSIPYDPVHRRDMTTVPRPTATETTTYARSKPITEATPWIMQEFVRGQEYCTHSLVRDGAVQVFCCCESSAFQINYRMVDKPEIEEWVGEFAQRLNLTGQVSFDFIQGDDGRLHAIECNPRTHSAITMFYDHPDLARAYLERGVPVVKPLPHSKPTYWIYHELWRLVTQRGGRAHRLAVIAQGKDAIFDWDDPLPFLLVHHLQIPSLLLSNLLRRKGWTGIDFNIGKLIEAAGD
ncbi:ATP-grasp domain-containing protein [Antrihabitans cavernicola]|uniref:ATP-grasp domain-containing protein n=1 Tax=Antrihabitans cavernicola TaxID=2495913 RepID=A0A5A7SAT3_9NOCA|nr:ATP-grasp domain-containing protein [Spelaeibacter cavernicola]KAA0022272.1 ATP-grasp domain-containing protein [Spelaeibacter cavernicola]